LIKMTSAAARTPAGLDFREIAVAARRGGKLDEAKNAGHRALAILEKALGPDHQDVASVAPDSSEGAGARPS
jgi:hypothetical protein